MKSTPDSVMEFARTANSGNSIVRLVRRERLEFRTSWDLLTCTLAAL